MADATDTITQGTLRTTDGRLLPLEATEVEGLIAGPVADVVVRQRFRNTGADPIEAVYLFPLPHEASVYRMHFRIEDRIVRAVVKEKAEARRVYERARSEGRAATLLEEDRPSLFSLSVANIAPGAVIDVELAYQEVVAFDDGHFRFVFPMVAPERYRDSAPAETPGTLAPPRLPTRERPPDVALSVVVRSASAGFPGAEAQIETLRCVSHKSETERLADGGVRVRLPSGAPILNRDFVLTWQASGSGVRPRVCFERKAGETGTFLLLVTPSEPRDDGRGMAQDVMRALRCGNCGGTVTDMTAIKDIPGLGPVVPCKYCGAILAPGTEPVTRALQPRDVVILVDRSASMRSSFAQARRAALAVMSGLALGDGVQLFAFDHDREPFHGDGTSFLALAPEVIEQADRFLSALGPRGGTELEEALLHAGKIPRREGRTRAVVLVTDATVGNEGRLLRRIPELLGASARLYVLGVGSAVDRRLIERLARAGGGAHDVILPDEDVEVTITRFARRVREGGPIVRDLGVFWEGAGMMSPHPSPVPDLFGGQPLRILGRFDGVGPTRLVITGRTVNEKAYRQEIDVDLPAQTSEVPGLARLWARRQVEVLAAKAAAEPHRRELPQEALALSLEHAIVGPYTSLVAEDSQQSVDPGTPAKRTPVPMAKTAEETAEYEGAAGAVAGAVDDDAEAPVMRTLSLGSRERPGGARRFTDDGGAPRGGAGPRRAPAAAPVLRAAMLSAAPRAEEDEEDEGSHLSTPVPGDLEESFAGLGPGTDGAADMKELCAAASEPEDEDRLFSSMPAASYSAPMAAAPAASYSAPMAAPEERSLGEDDVPEGAAKARGGGLLAKVRSFFGGGGHDEAAAAKASAEAEARARAAAAARVKLDAEKGSHAPEPPKAPPPGGAPTPARPASYSRPLVEEGKRDTSPPPRPVMPRGAPPVNVEPAGSEPYSADEMRIVTDRIPGQLDLVFLVDATGSMGPYIDEVQRHLTSMIEALRASPLCKSLRVAVVSYRDHPPEEQTYVTQVLSLTDDMDQVWVAVKKLSAYGGGDGPEAVTDGLFELVRLPFRPGAAKAVVWFGDAPPHGVEPSGDGFPRGCPCGHHWYTQAESCREMGIAVYAIGCYPTLGQYVGAQAVYEQVARTSRGLFLPLGDAEMLVPIITGAALSELDRQRIDEHVADLAALYPVVFGQTDEDERVRWLTEMLRHGGVRARAVQIARRRQRDAPLRFRDVTPEDVEGALFRLRAVDRL